MIGVLSDHKRTTRCSGRVKNTLMIAKIDKRVLIASSSLNETVRHVVHSVCTSQNKRIF